MSLNVDFLNPELSEFLDQYQDDLKYDLLDLFINRNDYIADLIPPSIKELFNINDDLIQV